MKINNRMKCQQCGSEAVYWKDIVISEATGPEATISLVLVIKRGTIQKSVCDSCAVGLRNIGWVSPESIVQIHVKPTAPKPVKALCPMPIPTRCIGCRLRVPIKYGGEGLHCFQNNGHCPPSAVRLALLMSDNGFGSPRKRFDNDEQMLEVLRL